MCDSLKLYSEEQADPCPATDAVFSATSCKIDLSNAPPLKRVKAHPQCGFPMSREAAKGWKKQMYKLPASEKSSHPA